MANKRLYQFMQEQQVQGLIERWANRTGIRGHFVQHLKSALQRASSAHLEIIFVFVLFFFKHERLIGISPRYWGWGGWNWHVFLSTRKQKTKHTQHTHGKWDTKMAPVIPLFIPTCIDFTTASSSWNDDYYYYYYNDMIHFQLRGWGVLTGMEAGIADIDPTWA